MTEQELRAAVAEYDAGLSREMEWDDESEDLFFNVGHGDGRMQFQRVDVRTSIDATMRAMDAAAKAFQEALK